MIQSLTTAEELTALKDRIVIMPDVPVPGDAEGIYQLEIDIPVDLMDRLEFHCEAKGVDIDDFLRNCITMGLHSSALLYDQVHHATRFDLIEQLFELCDFNGETDRIILREVLDRHVENSRTLKWDEETDELSETVQHVLKNGSDEERKELINLVRELHRDEFGTSDRNSGPLHSQNPDFRPEEASTRIMVSDIRRSGRIAINNRLHQFLSDRRNGDGG